MFRDSDNLIGLILWAVTATAILLIGAGFAGGFSGMFAIPRNVDALSFILWVAAMIFVALPFPLLLIVLIARRRK